MRFSSFLAVLPLVGMAFAQGQNFVVKVGDNGTLAFNPPSVTIQNGDSVSFQFLSKNHSVTQSTFAKPCELMTNADGTKGIDSGFQPVAANATQFQQFTFTVNNASAPLWFFCAQNTPANHCAAGMVFAINPTADKSFAAYQANAKASTTGTSASAGASSAASATGSATSGTAATPSASTTGTGANSGAVSIKASSVAGLLVAGVALVAGSIL
ncbi:hypothetical protein QCA50_003400 [Cerrena zonata]|uniref:Blue (type 1) copper domain-containing protein n=1 Tax=Cerrena zonata TaxID=2478898 RepID=A0AAW0GTV6_9APHY